MQFVSLYRFSRLDKNGRSCWKCSCILAFNVALNLIKYKSFDNAPNFTRILAAAIEACLFCQFLSLPLFNRQIGLVDTTPKLTEINFCASNYHSMNRTNRPSFTETLRETRCFTETWCFGKALIFALYEVIRHAQLQKPELIKQKQSL